MSNLNQVVLQGNLVDDPKTMGTENNVARFTIAVNNGHGEHKSTTFVDVVAFGKQVPIIAQYLTKGKQVIVRGSLMQNRWEDKDGNTRTKLEVRLENYSGFFFTGNAAGGTAPDESAPETVEAGTTQTEDGKLF